MGYSWGKVNAWCWVSPFPKAKCISPWVRRARPAGTKSFTPALTAKRQQWIMFINQPHSSSGVTAEGKQGRGSRMCFPSPRAQNKCYGWAVALCQPQALWHMQQAQPGVVKPHEAPPQGSAGSLGSKSTLIWLEKVAEPLVGHPGSRGRTWCGSCQHPSGISLRAEEWERLQAAVITPKHSSLGTQCHRIYAVILSHSHFRPKSWGEASALRVSCILWLRFTQLESWDHWYASLAWSASQCISMHWKDTKFNYFWKQGIFFNVWIVLFSSCSSKKKKNYCGKILRILMKKRCC